MIYTKKENILIISSIILFVYSYALFWFDELSLVLIMLTGGIAIFIIPICFLIILIQSIRYYKKEQNFLIFRNMDGLGEYYVQ